MLEVLTGPISQMTKSKGTQIGKKSNYSYLWYYDSTMTLPNKDSFGTILQLTNTFIKELAYKLNA